MYLIGILLLCLNTLTLLSVCAKYAPELRSSVLSYGKLNEYSDKPRTSLGSYLSSLTVPKYWFSHFYIIGFACSCICIIELMYLYYYHTPLCVIYLLHYDTSKGTHLDCSECVLGLCLMTVHLLRRVIESTMIERPSLSARMNISHYLIGIGFYGAMVIGTWIEGADHLGIWTGHFNGWNTLPMITTSLSLLLFMYASIHQYRCHSILASLRSHSHEEGYSIPRGDWFEYIVTPHYFADILIYLSLAILYQFKNSIINCGLIWTIVNLSITSNETKIWYQQHFKSKYTETFPHGRWRIIPFIY